MRTFISSLLLALFLSATASGQIAIEGGVNLANLAYKVNGDQLKTKFATLALVGLVGDIKMSDHIYFEPSVFYKGDGCKVSLADGSTLPVTLNTTTLNLTIEYQSGTKCSSRALFGAGPFLSFINSSTFGDEKSNSSTNLLKDKDFGISANVGYRVGKHWYLRITYSQGLVNLIDGGDDKNYIKTMGIGITGGFKMGGCRPKMYGSGHGRDNHHWRGLRNNGHYRKVRNYRHWLNY